MITKQLNPVFVNRLSTYGNDGLEKRINKN